MIVVYHIIQMIIVSFIFFWSIKVMLTSMMAKEQGLERYLYIFAFALILLGLELFNIWFTPHIL